LVLGSVVPRNSVVRIVGYFEIVVVVALVLVVNLVVVDYSIGLVFAGVVVGYFDFGLLYVG